MSSKIFGIADLPVGTIGDVVQINSNGQVPPPQLAEASPFEAGEKPSMPKALTKDTYSVPKKSNPFVRMRNGIGRLMKHFSHPKVKI
ncbi:hypothetical protein IKP85_06175 [bacterium]|nr:hypothetical protein [bacterium]